MMAVEKGNLAIVYILTNTSPITQPTSSSSSSSHLPSPLHFPTNPLLRTVSSPLFQTVTVSFRSTLSL